jgi:hypothetical protein
MNETKKNTLLALDELIAWIDESDYSDDFDPRLTPAEWTAAGELALTDADVAERVNFLKRIPQSQVLVPDSY